MYISALVLYLAMFAAAQIQEIKSMCGNMLDSAGQKNGICHFHPHYIIVLMLLQCGRCSLHQWWAAGKAEGNSIQNMSSIILRTSFTWHITRDESHALTGKLMAWWHRILLQANMRANRHITFCTFVTSGSYFRTLIVPLLTNTSSVLSARMTHCCLME